MPRRRPVVGSRKSERSGTATAIRRRTRGAQEPPRAYVPQHIPGEEVIPVISAPEQSRFRGSEYLHVSDALYKCVRKIAISEAVGNPMPPEPLFPSTGITFAQGHAIGDYIVSRTMDTAPDRLYGRWSCPCGHTAIQGTALEVVKSGDHDLCPKCSLPADKYVEISLRDDDLMVVGNVDMFLEDEDKAYTLVELKSIAIDQWRELFGPKPEHKAQILIYWYLARKLGWRVTDKVSVVYACKSYVRENPYKEFTMQPSVEMSFIEDYLQDFEWWARYKKSDDNEMPPRIMCRNLEAPAAKKCHVCLECFNDFD